MDEEEARPASASRRDLLRARSSRANRRPNSAMMMKTENVPRKRRTARKTSSSDEPSATAPKPVSVPEPSADSDEVAPALVVPFAIEEMDLGEGVSGPTPTEKREFKKILESNDMGGTYEPSDQRWKAASAAEQKEAEDATKQKKKKNTTAVAIPDELRANPNLPFLPCPEGTKLQCRIVRDKSSVDKSLFPTYYLYLDTMGKGPEGAPLLVARKKKRAGSSYYVITTTAEGLAQDTGFAAKLRATFIGTQFSLYSPGVSPAKLASAGHGAELREELAHVSYETNVLGFKGPRKMRALLPTVKSGTTERNRVIPQTESDGLARRHKNKHPDIMLLQNKPPEWNEQSNSYVLNFFGRVTKPSVKNFQIVHDSDLNYIILQFGRVAEHEFTMDINFPMSPLQAFGICLSSFDGKLAVE